MPDPVAARVIIPVKTDAQKATREFSRLDKQLDKVDQTATRNNQTWAKHRQSVKRSTNDIVKYAKAIGVTGAVLAVKSFVTSAIKAASDAEETSNKFNVVFSSIQDQAAKTAQELRTSFGLSSQESEKLLANTGDLLTGFGLTQQAALSMSSEVNKLAGDLASFTNIEGGAKRASAALTSALTGEREALKSLGIVVSEAAIKQKLLEKGQSKLTGQALLQAKAQATLAIATEQSGNAIGDFARSIGSFANQSKIAAASMEDLKVGFGKEFIKGLAAASVALNKMGTNFEDVGKGIATVVKSLLQLQVLDLIAQNNKDLEEAKVKIDVLGNAFGSFGKVVDKVTKKTGKGFRKNTKAVATLSQALQALSKAGDFDAQFQLLDQSLAKQLKLVKKFGLDTTMIERSFQQQRLTAIQEFITKSTENENLSLEQKKMALRVAAVSVLDSENLSYEERLLAQQTYTEASKNLEQQRMQEIAKGGRIFGEIGNSIVSIGQDIATARNNQIQSEINALREKGASEEEIAAKELKLRKQAARQAKAFGITLAIISGAVAVTNALATQPFVPLGLAMAVLAGAKVAAQIAAIATTLQQ
jgi:hypothetical protein